MHIGNRNFPYPVLNRNTNLSGYQPYCLFMHKFDVDDEGLPIIDGEYLVLKNAHYVLLDIYLERLCKEQQIQGVFVVDCAAGCFRKAFEVSSQPRDICIPLDRLKGSITVSCYLYAKQDIRSFSPTQLLRQYDGYSFDIEKFDILAVDDGVDFSIDIDESLDDRTASIFTIVKVDSLEGLARYEKRNRNIVIQLPADQYACYDNMKRHSSYNDISFAMIAIPVLAGCLAEIRIFLTEHGEDDLYEALDNWNWLNAVLKSYKRAMGNELDLETFMNTTAYELAQIVLNNASCKGLTVFNDILVGGLNNPDYESEGDDDND